MSDSKMSFWMTPREMMKSSSNLEDQRALITYNILFSGPLVISDADFINNPRLRNAVRRSDPFWIELIEQNQLLFAIREQDGNRVGMRSTAQDLRSRGVQAQQNSTDVNEEDSEFMFVETEAQSLTFSLEGAESRFVKEIHRIFRDTAFREEDLPNNYAQAIAEFCETKIAEREALNWNDFNAQSEGSPRALWEVLEKRFPGSDIAGKYGAFIRNVARGPYATFLPETLEISPTFSHEDRLGVEIWRGRYELDREELQQITLARSRPSLVDYKTGLAALSVSDILKLRNSTELQAYELNCKLFAESKTSSRDSLEALHEYRRLVDDAIFRVLKHSPPRQQTPEEYSITACTPKIYSGKKSKPVYLRFFAELAAEAALPVPLIPSILKFGYERVQEWTGNDEPTKAFHEGVQIGAAEARREEIDKELLISKLEKSSPSGVIDSEIIVDRPGVYDLCTSFRDSGTVRDNFS